MAVVSTSFLIIMKTKMPPVAHASIPERTVTNLVSFPLLYAALLFHPKRVYSDLASYGSHASLLFWFVPFALQVALVLSFTAQPLGDSAGTLGGVFLRLGATALVATVIVPSLLIPPLAFVAASFTARALKRNGLVCSKLALFNGFVFATGPLLLLGVITLYPALSALSAVQVLAWIWSVALAGFGTAWYLKVPLPKLLPVLGQAAILTTAVALPVVVVLIAATVAGGLILTSKSEIELGNGVRDTGQEPASASPPSASPSNSHPVYADWKSYTNTKYGYSLEYPAISIVSAIVQNDEGKDAPGKSDAPDARRLSFTPNLTKVKTFTSYNWVVAAYPATKPEAEITQSSLDCRHEINRTQVVVSGQPATWVKAVDACKSALMPEANNTEESVNLVIIRRSEITLVLSCRGRMEYGDCADANFRHFLEHFQFSS